MEQCLLLRKSRFISIAVTKNFPPDRRPKYQTPATSPRLPHVLAHSTSLGNYQEKQRATGSQDVNTKTLRSRLLAESRGWIADG
jgi:hypothetical protein